MPESNLLIKPGTTPTPFDPNWRPNYSGRPISAGYKGSPQYNQIQARDLSGPGFTIAQTINGRTVDPATGKVGAPLAVNIDPENGLQVASPEWLAWQKANHPEDFQNTGEVVALAQGGPVTAQAQYPSGGGNPQLAALMATMSNSMAPTNDPFRNYPGLFNYAGLPDPFSNYKF